MPETVRHFAAGAIGGAVAATITCPLEVVKTRLQAYKATRLPLLRLFRDIIRNEGPQALFRGLSATLAGVGPARATYFATYQFGKQNFPADGPLLHLLSAACAGCVTSTVTSPIWVVKTRLQLQNNSLRRSKPSTASTSTSPLNRPYRGIRDAFSTVYREEGARGFFKGLSASYLGVSESVIQFLIYERLKLMVLTFRQEQLGPKSMWTEAKNNSATFPSTWAIGIGAIAKLIASLMTYPHEVLRTRLREQRYESRYRGLIDAFRQILSNEGSRGLYGGIGPHLLRTVPNAAILFFVVETVLGGDV